MANDDGITAYAEIVEDIGHRVLHAEQCLSLWNEDNRQSLRLEEAALQVRMICESTLFASFSLHSKVVDDLLSTLKKNDTWDKLKKILENENPNYMPYPISSVRTSSGVIQIAPLKNRFISGSDLFKIWGKASELLHFRNPLKSELSMQAKADEFAIALGGFKGVLHQHAIAIPSDGMLYMVNVDFTSGKPKVLWWIASQTHNLDD
jgi:hypothetical protein